MLYLFQTLLKEVNYLLFWCCFKLLAIKYIRRLPERTGQLLQVSLPRGKVEGSSAACMTAGHIGQRIF